MKTRHYSRFLSAASFSFLFILCVSVDAQEVCQSPGVAIPDNSSISRTLTIDQNELIGNIDVYLDISHTYVGDLRISLKHLETDTTVTIVDRPGYQGAGYGCPRDNIDAVLDDAATEEVEDQCELGAAAISGTFSPNNALSGFHAETTNGRWTLTVEDRTAGQTGTLDKWCLRFANDFDGDGIIDRDDNCHLHANASQDNSDNDLSGDACDSCPGDPLKGFFPRECGCGEPDVDIDGDGNIDCSVSNIVKTMLTRKGVLLVANPATDGVMAFDPQNGYLVDPEFIVDSAHIPWPYHAILNAEQDGILVSDGTVDAVYEYDFDGNYVGLFAPAAGINSTVLNAPRGMALMASGDLLVVDGINDTVAKFNTSGVAQGNLISAGLDNPWDIEIVGSRILVTMSGGGVHTVKRFNLSDGSFESTYYTSIPTTPEQMNRGQTGNVLIAVHSGASIGVTEVGADGGEVGRYAPITRETFGPRGAYQLAGSNEFLVSGRGGVKIVGQNGRLVRTVWEADGPRFVQFVLVDADGDGTGDTLDACPNDPTKTDPGACGCGSWDGLTDTDSDGTPDCADTDDDGDGLSDADEATYSTDPLDPDSDDDGVTDGQEVTDATNPTDRGSALPVLGTTLCAEWNGYLGGMWNILEHVNMSSGDISVRTSIFDIWGIAQSWETNTIAAGSQLDVLVHTMSGYSLDSYGKVCSELLSGSAGDLDGRMVYYKEAGASVPPTYSFQFAFAMPFLNGIVGKQYVPFNTFQPSLDWADAGNLVANWIQLTNLENTEQTGTLTFYGEDGSVLGSESVTLSFGARRDFSGHAYGTNRVGIVEWSPTSASARFQLRNVRYLYDNAGSANSFDSAFQLGGMAGSGEKLVAPLDTTRGSSILEVANTSASAVDVRLQIYNAGGTALRTEDFELPAHGSRHIIADTILSGAQGVATIDGSASESVIATVMQYERTASLGIQHLYGIQARQPLGSTLRSSYNTFIEQGCRLYISNGSASDVAATLGMQRNDGTSVLGGESVTVPGYGLLDVNLCAYDISDVYGVVTVQPATTNTLVADVVRVRNNNEYRFPTPVRQ